MKFKSVFAPMVGLCTIGLSSVCQAETTWPIVSTGGSSYNNRFFYDLLDFSEEHILATERDSADACVIKSGADHQYKFYVAHSMKPLHMGWSAAIFHKAVDRPAEFVRRAQKGVDYDGVPPEEYDPNNLEWGKFWLLKPLGQDNYLLLKGYADGGERSTPNNSLIIYDESTVSTPTEQQDWTHDSPAPNWHEDRDPESPFQFGARS